MPSAPLHPRGPPKALALFSPCESLHNPLARSELRPTIGTIVSPPLAKSNRSAIGARVIARYGGKQQVQEVLSQCSFYSANDPRLHFGIGASHKVDLEVRWPGGTSWKFEALDAGQLVILHEGSPKAGLAPWPGH